MAYKATPEVILSIKREIDRRKLTIPEVIRQLSEAGHPLSESTIRRVLRDGSEEHSADFRYETAIRPFWDVFMTDTSDASKSDLQQRISDLDALIAMKNEAIAELRDRIAKLEASFVEKCTECNATNALWREQIRLKDQRIDRKDKQIDDLQSQINRLMDIVLGRIENNT